MRTRSGGIRRQLGHALIAAIPKSRADAGGAANVDVESSCGARAKAFIEGLSSQDRAMMIVWRAGAMSSPTRRAGVKHKPGVLEEQMEEEAFDELAVATACPLCGQCFASGRHYFADCPALDAERGRIGAAHHITRDWWALQPEITSKTGWLTFAAHADRRRREDCAVAVLKLGRCIMRLVPAGQQ